MDYKMTAQQRKEYKASGGQKCPWCDEADLIFEEITVDFNTVTQEVFCPGCERYWFNVYAFTHIDTPEEVEERDINGKEINRGSAS